MAWVTNEDGSLSTPKKGNPDVLGDAKDALANTIINNAELTKPATGGDGHRNRLSPGCTNYEGRRYEQGEWWGRSGRGSNPVWNHA